MTADWTPLSNELTRWRDAGLVLPLWWRDDDAVTATPALDRLAALAGDLGMPVHLAVIPARADDQLAVLVAGNPDLLPLVHGWAHANHAGPTDKKAEFGGQRPTATCRAEATQGLQRLQDLFGARLCPIFVPPWNRIAPDLVAELAGCGFTALSTFTPRSAALAAPGLAQINSHLDPIAWRKGGGLVDPDQLIAQIVRQLTDRRIGPADNDEPYGLLTHHLVHDAAIWQFCEDLLTRLNAGPVRHWTARELTD